jgi:YbbR domain-containing protein
MILLFMRDAITKDFGWKLFSLALAVIIWLTVKAVSTENPRDAYPLGDWGTRSFTNLPVLVVSAAADVRELKVRPDNVEVTVRGRPEIMTALQQQEIHVLVDLTDIESARGMRKRINASAPPGVTIIRVEPSEVDVVIPVKKDSTPRP